MLGVEWQPVRVLGQDLAPFVAHRDSGLSVVGASP